MTGQKCMLGNFHPSEQEYPVQVAEHHLFTVPLSKDSSLELPSSRINQFLPSARPASNDAVSARRLALVTDGLKLYE